MSGLIAQFACLLMATTPLAQPATRAAAIEAERAAKAASLRPVERGRLNDIMFAIEDRYLVERFFDAPRGVFLRFGGFPTGAGLAAGPAYRYSRLTVVGTVWGGVSTLRYWEVGGTLAFPRLAYGKAFVEFDARRHEYPQEDFYGFGDDSSEADETSFTFRQTAVSATAGVDPTWWLRASTSVAHLSPRAGTGHDRDDPSIEQVFPDEAGFGAASQPNYLRLGARAAVDSTGRPFGPGTGGRHVVAYDRYLDQGAGVSSFHQLEADLRQYVPVFGTTRALALRAHYVSLLPDAGDEVPFYLQPTLGGPDSLRGLSSYRLRDRNTLLFQSEYRWDANAFLGGVLFYEAGSVARRPSDFRLDRFTQDYGAGIRIGFLSTVSLRFEAVFGAGEGTVLLFRFSDVF